MNFTAKVLVVRIQYPLGNQTLVGQFLHVLNHQQSSHAPTEICLLPTGITELLAPVFFEYFPLD